MFTKPNALVYVLRDRLLITGKHVTHARLDFPSDKVNNLEVLNPPMFEELCAQFFLDNGLKRKRVLVVLDHGVVFRKNIKLDESGQPDTLTEVFIDQMPFNQGQRVCLSVQADNLLQLLATNADLCTGISNSLRSVGVSKIVAVTPVAVFNLSDTNHKFSSLSERLLKDASFARQADFLSAEAI